MPPVAKAPADVATSFEESVKPGGNRDFTGVIDDVRNARRDPDFMKAFNTSLSSNKDTAAVLGDFQIEGADKDQQQLVAFKKIGEREVRYEIDAQGNRTNDVWGDPDHDREFQIDGKGTATHEVKSGETVWAVASDIIREQKGDPSYKPEPKEVLSMIKRLQAENPALDPARGGDPDRIKPGQIITVPQDVTREIKDKRDEPLVEKDESGQVKRVQYPDGTSFEVVKRDPTTGEITEYKDREGKEFCRKEGTNPPVWENRCNVKETWAGTIAVGDDGTVEWQSENKKHTMTVDGNHTAEDIKPASGPPATAPTEAQPPRTAVKPAAAATNQQKAEAKAFNLRPTNGVYNPLAAPGLCQGTADQPITSEAAGLDQSGSEDQDNFDIERRDVKKVTEEQARASNLVPGDVAIAQGGVIRQFNGQLDAYRGDADPNVHYDDPNFQAVQVTDAENNVVYNKVEYEKGVNMYFQTGNSPDQYMEFKFVKKVETKYDAASGTYTTTIYADQGTKPYTIRTDKSGKVMKVEDTVSSR